MLADNLVFCLKQIAVQHHKKAAGADRALPQGDTAAEFHTLVCCACARVGFPKAERRCADPRLRPEWVMLRTSRLFKDVDVGLQVDAGDVLTMFAKEQRGRAAVGPFVHPSFVHRVFERVIIEGQDKQPT